MSHVEARESSAVNLHAAPLRRIRVLMGVPARGATAGGPALHLPMLVEDLRNGGKVEVVTIPFGRWAEGEPLPLKIWHQIVDLFEYAKRIRGSQFDLVHLNSALDRRAVLRDLAFAALTRLAGIPLMIKWHGGEIEMLRGGSPVWRALARRLLRLTDTVAVLSLEEAEEVRSLPRAPHVEVVRNALDLRRYRCKPDLRQRFRLPASVPLLLFIGRLLPAKGLEDVIRSLPGLISRHGTHLMVVGDGPSLDPARRLARELGVETHVHFTGQLSEEDALEFYRGCDILVFPTHHPEGFPMVVFQSVAAGLGVVTTQIRAMADYLEDGKNCLFVPPRDPQRVGEALQSLFEDPQLLEEMKRANRQLANRFERSVIATEFEAIYRGIFDRGKRRGSRASAGTGYSDPCGNS